MVAPTTPWPSALCIPASADRLRTRTGPLEAGVVVLVSILVRGTRMQLCHRARPLSGRRSTGSASVGLPIQLCGPEVYLRAVRPEWPCPAAALQAGAIAGVFCMAASCLTIRKAACRLARPAYLVCHWESWLPAARYCSHCSPDDMARVLRCGRRDGGSVQVDE